MSIRSYTDRMIPMNRIQKVQIPPKEWSDELGARRLANKLRRYWLNCGYPEAEFWVSKTPGRRIFYQVRSNLLNGIPNVSK